MSSGLVCNACGNKTRFDVTIRRRTREFHHYDLSGAMKVEDVEILEEEVEALACRWCGHGKAVERAE